jgi:hypothetical protein
VIGQLHDELLPHHARGAQDADVYSAGNHCKLLSKAPMGLPRRSAEREGGQKKTRRLLSLGGLLNLGSLLC